VWDNEGNPKNAIFTPSHAPHYLVKAIDNNTTSIDPTTHAGNFEIYKNKVAGTLRAIFHGGETACAATKNVRDFIALHTGYPFFIFCGFQQFFLMNCDELVDRYNFNIIIYLFFCMSLVQPTDFESHLGSFLECGVGLVS
jgi:hypothetical protein